MTTELEKQFFRTFGIEPKPLFSTRNGYTNDAYCYPPITDRILLELICIAMQTYDELAIYRVYTVNAIKEKTLKLLIRAQDDVYSQVQVLFKE